MPHKIREKSIFAFMAEEKAVNEEQRKIRFVISTGDVDRHREIVEPSAIADAIKNFSKNPVCLAGHAHRLDNGMPSVIGSWDTESFKATAKRCEMDLVFADTELAQQYWLLYKSKHMRAVSIGFRILDGHEETKNGVRIYIIEKIELYEISCVAVPANASALSKYYKDGTEFTAAEDAKIADFTKSLNDKLNDLQTAFETRLNTLEEQLLTALDELKDLSCGLDSNTDPYADPAGGASDKRSERPDDPADGCSTLAEQLNELNNNLQTLLKGKSNA